MFKDLHAGDDVLFTDEGKVILTVLIKSFLEYIFIIDDYLKSNDKNIAPMQVEFLQTSEHMYIEILSIHVLFNKMFNTNK